MAAVTAAKIPALLERYGLTEADVRWDPVRQESSFRYTKNVDWTDSSGTPQTCQAKRQVNFVGPDGVRMVDGPCRIVYYYHLPKTGGGTLVRHFGSQPLVQMLRYESTMYVPPQNKSLFYWEHQVGRCRLTSG